MIRYSTFSFFVSKKERKRKKYIYTYINMTGMSRIMYANNVEDICFWVVISVI